MTAVLAVGVVSVNKVTRAVDEKTSAVKKSVEESPLGAAKLKVRRPCPRLSARHGRTPKHLSLAPVLAPVLALVLVLVLALALPLPLPLPPALHLHSSSVPVCRARAVHAYHKVSDALESVRKAAAGLGES